MVSPSVASVHVDEDAAEFSAAAADALPASAVQPSLAMIARCEREADDFAFVQRLCREEDKVRGGQKRVYTKLLSPEIFKAASDEEEAFPPPLLRLLRPKLFRRSSFCCLCW